MLLPIVLGGIGADSFYLDRPGWGRVPALLLDLVPMMLGLIEGLLHLGMTDEGLSRKYGRRAVAASV